MRSCVGSFFYLHFIGGRIRKDGVSVCRACGFSLSGPLPLVAADAPDEDAQCATVPAGKPATLDDDLVLAGALQEIMKYEPGLGVLPPFHFTKTQIVEDDGVTPFLDGVVALAE